MVAILALIYIESCVNSSVVEPLSFAFAKVFRVDDLFNGPLLVILIFILVLD